MLPIKLGFDWPSGFREEDLKKLNIFVIYMYIAMGWGQTNPWGPIFFSELPTFSPFAHFLQDLPFKVFLTIFPIQLHGRPMLTLP